ncbi:MAG: porin family protein, partial [Xanthobacteraceae bacterium]|nr:porin family protein [Xanthobacteraceae bacterium]
SGLAARRLFLSLYSFFIAGAAGLGPVSAQYAPQPPAVLVVVPSWSGGYVGLNAGVAGGADAITSTSTGFIAISGSGTMQALGGTAGLLAGYNWEVGGWVVGVEGDVSYLGLNGSQDMTATNFVSVTEHDSFETSWLATLRGRFGYAWGHWLFYLTAGGALGDHKYNGVIQTFGIANPSGSVIKGGWTVGLGSEWMIAPNWTAKVEYLVADLGTETFTASQVSVSGRLVEDMVRVGVNYKFSW